jgi:signal transduction histidine kinase
VQLYLAVAALSTLCVAAVVTERREFARRLAASRARIVEASARERRRVERDLHDGVQQRLIALSIRLELGAEQVRQNPGSAVGRLQAAGIEVTAALEELRELTHGFHPSVLTDHGLAGALRRLAAESPITLRLLELPEGRVATTAEVTAYFVVLEAVANAHKHAEANAIEIRARVADGRLELVISDDGRGGADERAGSGLQGLRDRVEAPGGTFMVTSAPGQGTRIEATLPA